MISMFVPAQFPVLKRSIVDLLTNNCMNIEVIPFLGNELMKHDLNDVERHFMSCLIPFHFTYNILISPKQESNLEWSGEQSQM